MFFKNQSIFSGLAVPPLPPSWKIPPKVRGIINETVPNSKWLRKALTESLAEVVEHAGYGFRLLASIPGLISAAAPPAPLLCRQEAGVVLF